MDESKKKVNMKYNQLGNTGLRVSEICLGAMTFSLTSSNSWYFFAFVYILKR